MRTDTDVKTFLSGYFAKKMASKGIRELEDGLNLIECGLIDSFGLMDLILSAEKKFGLELDMSTVDLEEFTTVSGFSKTICSL